MTRRWLITALFGFGLALASVVALWWGGDRPAEPQRPKLDMAAKRAQANSDRLWVDGGVYARPAAPVGAKNLVLIVLTGVRKDALTPYGAAPDRSPFLHRLAERGARFTDALSAAPYTRQAAVAMLTGRHAIEVGVVNRERDPRPEVLGAEVQTLAERLRAAGWATYGATSNFHVNVEGGLGRGFDRYRNAPDKSFEPKNRVEAAVIVEQALSLFDEPPAELAARPFFLQVWLADAHPPNARIEALEARFGGPESPNVHYRSAVFRVDQKVGELVRGLEALGFAGEDTVIAVVADHGEGLGDPPHHGKAHGRLLYESTVSVPWIVTGPDIPPNRLVAGLASHTDVAPTLLELVGGPALTGVDGRSHAAALRGEVERTDRQRAFTDTWVGPVNRAAIWTDALQCQRDFGSLPAAASDAFADGCYSRRTDPTFTNLTADPALQAELDAWRAGFDR